LRPPSRNPHNRTLAIAARFSSTRGIAGQARNDGMGVCRVTFVTPKILYFVLLLTTSVVSAMIASNIYCGIGVKHYHEYALFL
jgi:hypothetical protein